MIGFDSYSGIDAPRQTAPSSQPFREPNETNRSAMEEWKEVLRGLDALQQVEANFQGRRFLFCSQLTAHTSQALRAAGGRDTTYFAGAPVR